MDSYYKLFYLPTTVATKAEKKTAGNSRAK